ncbi:MAG: hypothetical protein NT166_07980 [Candidatus Aminicenantes bacterium]|nr:hypothetical protein [Candidatus Aminicenantes bacterium]
MNNKKIHIAIGLQKTGQIYLSSVLYFANCDINGGVVVFSDQFRGAKRQTRWVHNGPGIRENAAPIDNRYAKKQYHRAFKANAAAPVSDYTAVVHDRTALVQDNTEPVHDRTAVVQDNFGLVHDRTAPVQDNTGPVHDRTAVVQDNFGLVHDRTAPVQDNFGLVHDCTASVQNITASVSDDAGFVTRILIPMRYCKSKVKNI